MSIYLFIYLAVLTRCEKAGFVSFYPAAIIHANVRFL